MDGLDTQALGDAGRTETPPENTLESDLAGALTFYVVYWNPADFPGRWVVKRVCVRDFEVATESAFWGEAETLNQLRNEFKPPTTITISRHDQDDPVVWETWV